MIYVAFASNFIAPLETNSIAFAHLTDFLSSSAAVLRFVVMQIDRPSDPSASAV